MGIRVPFGRNQVRGPGVEATDDRCHRCHIRDATVVQRSFDVPVIVDLWAEWCQPCRTLGPVIEKAVAATAGKVELAKVDVDANPRISATFQVKSIPAVFALKDGRIVDSFVGALPEPSVVSFVKKLAVVAVGRRQAGRGGRRGVVPRRRWSWSPTTRVPSWGWPRSWSGGARPTRPSSC